MSRALHRDFVGATLAMLLDRVGVAAILALGSTGVGREASCSRRQVLSHAAFAAAALAPPPAYAQTEPGEANRAALKDKLNDPFAGVRESRAPFADEMAPSDAETRRIRAQAASKASRETRAFPQVSKLSGPAAAPTSGATDELIVEFEPGRPLGLKLKDLRIGTEYGTYEGTSRVLVSEVLPGGQAEKSGKVGVDFIVVAVDGVNVERETALQVQRRLASAVSDGRSPSVTFKDPNAFNARLRKPEATSQIATEIAPATPTSSAQVLGVRRLNVPPGCTRNAENGDLLEIRYAGRLEDGSVFDGMKLADRLGDDSIQFVLGRQPAGQFPPSWDVGLTGMCVGERREIDVPPVRTTLIGPRTYCTQYHSPSHLPASSQLHASASPSDLKSGCVCLLIARGARSSDTDRRGS